MKKIFRMTMLLAMMAACVSMGSCSSDDEEPEYVPVESAFSTLLKKKPVHQLSYQSNYGKGFFSLWSNPLSDKTYYKSDYYVVSFSVNNAPSNGMYNGRYEVSQVDGSVWGWEKQWDPEYKKHELSTWENKQPVKGAWVEIKTLDKGDEYGQKMFKITLHVDEMTEKNGDYARNINISFTGRDVGPMLIN